VQLEQARGGERSWLRPLSNEYAPALIAALESNSDWGFQANVMNEGYISNLSQNMCVEVPCTVSRGHVGPVHIGALPLSVAGLTQQSLTVQELVVEAVLRHDRDLLFEAIMLDPQASATLTLSNIARLTGDLLQAYEPLPRYESRRLQLFERMPE
jgi:alpha-galactosidase